MVVKKEACLHKAFLVGSTEFLFLEECDFPVSAVIIL